MTRAKLLRSRMSRKAHVRFWRPAGQVTDRLSSTHQRPETAALVVRRRHLGAASNDVGFARTAEGYVPVLSEYDRRALHGGQFLVKLRTAYSERVVEEVGRRLHGTSRRTVEGGIVRITVRY